ncbi:DUF3617 domain-containing protein [Paucibacter oligotrophus]|uniref:DUF3617 domain-containing protein n=2 Tax=Roseateles oligotrophus TaxID=1769250 RepID=A0ABT2YCX9_9BURK|nr:DUF3617 domain-containing protein [Roseateles oligotrophus]
MFSPRQVSSCLLAAVLLSGVQAALAQNIKPGLWENKMQPQLSPERQAMMAEAQKQMSAMPAEQRKMIQDMMDKQGISADIGSGLVTMKVCITPEQAALNELPIDDKGKCQYQIQRHGKQIQSQFTCSDPQISGESSATINSAESYSSTMRATTLMNGKSEAMTMTGQGRWLGTDCGGIAPMKSGKAKG